MSSEDCDIPNPLVRDGASRPQRFLRALSPRHARVDERTISDFLRFAREYGRGLQYWDARNQPAGGWEEFFQSDVSAALAGIAGFDPAQYRRWRDELIAAAAGSSIKKIRDDGLLPLMFGLLFAMAGEINEWDSRIDAASGYKDVLARVVGAPVRGELIRVLERYRCLKRNAWFSELFNPPAAWEGLWKRGRWGLHQALTPVWRAESGARAPNLENWSIALADPGACGPFAALGLSAKDPWLDALKALDQSFEIFYGALARLKREAGGFLAATLTRWPSHEPHMALWLAFLRLRQFGQAHLNSLTRVHLDFFYRRVLGLHPREAGPDAVHVIFALAKHASSCLIPAGTLLKAGKDALGKDIHYRVNGDLAVNRAALKDPGDVKCIFIDRFNEKDRGRLYAAPQAASADGLGKPFAVAEPMWKPFGKTQNPGGVPLPLAERTMVPGLIGFAVASPVLDLREGTRTVEVKIFCDTLPQGLAAGTMQFVCRFGGAKGWQEYPAAPTVQAADKALFFALEIDASAPPVGAADPAVLGKGYPSDVPVLEILLRNDFDVKPPSAYAYQALKDLKVRKVVLTVKVKHAKNLVLQTDSGPVKAGKPFHPFGAQPVKGSGFCVGSDEAFRKALNRVELKYEWLEPPPTDWATYYAEYISVLKSFSVDFRVDLLKLEDRNWVKLPLDQQPLGRPIFTLNGADKLLEAFDVHAQAAPDLPPIRGLETDTARGFLRVELSSPADAFGHKQYATVLATQAVLLSTSPTTELPNPPFTPVLKSLALDYDSEATLDLAAPGLRQRFYHVTPFGFDERRAQSIGAALTYPPLLPRFIHDPAEPIKGSAAPLENEGELYLGFSDLDAPGNLAVLFKVAEGSVEPDLPKQRVFWSYLSGNAWKPFRTREILSDTTLGLIASGIIVFQVPGDADLEHTVLPAGRRWLRASVPGNSGAVCSMLGIDTQAAEASFEDRGNDPAFLAAALPAGVISKLAEKRAEIKSVRQPYASFGGRVAERPRTFDVRVSERLRHKGRPVAIWDYERLVLERFPSVHKVKCINHSTYDFKDGSLEIASSEFAPGFVTVVVVPDQRNLSAVNPLEPRASLAMLEEIRAYLAALMPPFAARRLRVLNPSYEGVKAEFSVRFRPGLDFGYHRDRLNQDLKRFLSPWAYGATGEGELVFGGRMHRSTLMYFVEKLDYVDYLANFIMKYRGQPVEEAAPASARSIFVSEASHTINEVIG